MGKILIWSFIALFIGIVSGALVMNVYNNRQSPHKDEKTVKIKGEKLPHINPLVSAKGFKEVYFDEMLGCNREVLGRIDQLMIDYPNFELSFYFKDLTTATVIEYNEDVKFTPSSLMKVPVLMALFKEAEKKPKLLQKLVVFQQRIDHAVTDDQYNFKKGQEYSLIELAEIMIKHSDNTATFMIVNEIGLNKVKKVEIDLRLGTEKVMDGKERVIGIKSYCRVFRVLYNASYLSKEHSEQCLEILTTSRYKKGIRRAIPKDIDVAQKFGRRDLDVYDVNEQMHIEQLHHVGIVYRKHKPYLIGVMIKGDDEVAMEKAIYELTLDVDQIIQTQVDLIEEENISADLR